MLRRDIAGRGISCPRVLKAMEEVPREQFVPARLARHAYGDGPIPIGLGQTISQPYVVAWMADALKLTPADRVLEIGTGSGYAAAVLSRLAKEVFSVERHESLASSAQSRLEQLGFGNVQVRVGDGSEGWPGHAPFSAILVSAAVPRVPGPLRDQLASAGRLIAPVGSRFGSQVLVRERRVASGDLLRERLGRVRFVPLIGAEGWA